MATSIQLDEGTLEALRELKSKLHASSYDDVIRRLLLTHRKRSMPLRGLTPGIGRFERDHDERD